jgi:hypothetical protein
VRVATAVHGGAKRADSVDCWVARAERRRHEEVDLPAVRGRVDPDPGEVVEPEADVVRGLCRGEGGAALLQLHPDVQVRIVVQQHEARAVRARPLRGDRLQPGGDDRLLPNRIGQRGIERGRLLGPNRGKAAGRTGRGARRPGLTEECKQPACQDERAQSHGP